MLTRRSKLLSFEDFPKKTFKNVQKCSKITKIFSIWFESMGKGKSWTFAWELKFHFLALLELKANSNPFISSPNYISLIKIFEKKRNLEKKISKFLIRRFGFLIKALCLTGLYLNLNHLKPKVKKIRKNS